MSIINSTFKNLQKNKSKALVTYTVAGDPDLELSEEIIEEIINSGADIIEIGVPFSDPMSEGPVIQLAHERSLKNKTSLPEILSLSKRLKKKFNNTPIVLMGYFNTFINSLNSDNNFHDINDEICEELKNSGVDGLIIVDLPFEESEVIFKKLSEYQIDLIRLISPTTSELRINEIINNSSGFLYYVSLKGITGADISSYEELDKRVQNIKKIDFAKHAESLGAIGENVNSITELEQAYTRAKKSKSTYVISIKTDGYQWLEGSAYWESPTLTKPSTKENERALKEHLQGKSKQRQGV